MSMSPASADSVLVDSLLVELLDEQLDEQTLRRGHAAFFSSCAATSSAQARGAIGKPSRARLSR